MKSERRGADTLRVTIQRTHGFFFAEMLDHLELPVRNAGLRALACVSIFESSEGNEKWFNPLAVEQPWPGSTAYNAAGVRRYATIWDGVHATAQLYGQPHWAAVRKAIQVNTVRTAILEAFSEAYTWAKVDFNALPCNVTATLDVRLAHNLYGP